MLGRALPPTQGDRRLQNGLGLACRREAALVQQRRQQVGAAVQAVFDLGDLQLPLTVLARCVVVVVVVVVAYRAAACDDDSWRSTRSASGLLESSGNHLLPRLLLLSPAPHGVFGVAAAVGRCAEG